MEGFVKLTTLLLMAVFCVVLGFCVAVGLRLGEDTYDLRLKEQIKKRLRSSKEAE